MQSLIYAIVVTLVVSFAGYKALHYLPYILRHIIEILAYTAVGLVVAGIGYFITHFGIIEENK